jgi:hypothetical protein
LVLKFSINYFIYFATIATVVPYLQQILKMQGFRAYEIGLLLAVGSSISFLFFIFDIGFITAALVLILFGMMYRPIASLTDALASRTLPFAIRQYGYARIWGSIGFVGISFFYQIWGFLYFSDSYGATFF